MLPFNWKLITTWPVWIPHGQETKRQRKGLLDWLGQMILTIKGNWTAMTLQRWGAVCLECGGSSRAVVPNLFGTRDRFHGRQFFQGPGWGGEGYGFRMIQVYYIYCAHCFCYYISSTSDHQVLDPRGWGSLLWGYLLVFPHPLLRVNGKPQKPITSKLLRQMPPGKAPRPGELFAENKGI